MSVVSKFRPDLSVHLKNIAEKKTGPRKAETDSRAGPQDILLSIFCISAVISG